MTFWECCKVHLCELTEAVMGGISRGKVWRRCTGLMTGIKWGVRAWEDRRLLLFWEASFVAASTLYFKIRAKVSQTLRWVLWSAYFGLKSKWMIILFPVLMIHFVFQISQRLSINLNPSSRLCFFQNTYTIKLVWLFKD